MATPTVVFNSSTGSDSLASGAGPSTALTGTGASYSTTTVTLDSGTDLSGVATDGSHVLYLVTSTGRKFFEITGSAGSGGATPTVTVGTAPTGTSSGLSWAIGGKRATFNATNSRQLFADVKGGWKIQAEDDGAVALTGSAITCSGTGTAQSQVCVEGSSITSRRACTQSANAAHFSVTVTGWVFKNLTFTNTNGTKTSANALSLGANSVRVAVHNCVFGDGTNHLNAAVSSASQGLIVRLFNCYFNAQRSGATSGQVIDFTGNTAHSVFLRGCVATGAVGPCVRLTGTGSSLVSLWRTILNTPGGDGITVAATAGCDIEVIDSTLNGGSADGIDVSAAVQLSTTLLNSIVSNFAGGSMYGVRGASGQDSQYGDVIDCNDFYNNTSHRLNFATGPNDISVDPGYVNSGSLNFGTGANVKDKGWPAGASVTLGANQSATNSYPDIGAAEQQNAGSGGGLQVHPGMTGGFRG